jgi:hypothetical protein
MTWRLLTKLRALVLVGCFGVFVSGCGRERSRDEGAMRGDPHDSYFSVVFIDEDGTRSEFSERLSNKVAEFQGWGARIVDSSLMIRLPIPDEGTLTFSVRTSEISSLPGSFDITPDRVRLFGPGLDFTSGYGGTLELTTCPRGLGAKAVGNFEGIVLEPQYGSNLGSRIISGHFDVVVYSKTGDLNCRYARTPSPGSCEEPMCDWNGGCCPYVGCYTECMYQCSGSWQACAGEEEPTCAACDAHCAAGCRLSNNCLNAAEGLQQCLNQNGCNAVWDQFAWYHGDDEADRCVMNHCCALFHEVFY